VPFFLIRKGEKKETGIGKAEQVRNRVFRCFLFAFFFFEFSEEQELEQEKAGN
jgi:hypothetical protein